jgi:hypothetical protein
VTGLDLIVSKADLVAKSCYELWKHHANKDGINLQFALVQTGPTMNYDFLRTKEKENLEKFFKKASETRNEEGQLLFPKGILKDNGEPLFMRGIPALQYQLCVRALKDLNENSITSTRERMMNKASKLEKQIEIGRKIHGYVELSQDISSKFLVESQIADCDEVFQKEVCTVLCSATEEIFQKRLEEQGVPKPSVSLCSPGLGHVAKSEGDKKQADEIAYRREFKHFMLQLKKSGPQIAELMFQCLTNGPGIKQMFEDTADYVKLTAWLQAELDKFADTNKAKIVQIIRENIEDQAYCPSIITREIATLWSPNSLLVLHGKTNPLVKHLRCALTTVILHLQAILVTKFNRLVLHQFAISLQKSMSNLENGALNEMSDEELTRKQEKLDDYRKNIKALDELEILLQNVLGTPKRLKTYRGTFSFLSFLNWGNK